MSKTKCYSIIAFWFFILTIPSFSQIELTYDTTQDWYNTGYRYTANKKIYILCSGVHVDDTNLNNIVYSPSGWPFYNKTDIPLPSAPENSLIGKLGSNGKPFYIGTGGRFISTESGLLYVRVNDQILSNNRGKLLVGIFDGRSTEIIFNSTDDWYNTGYNCVHGKEVFLYATGAHDDDRTLEWWAYYFTPAGRNLIEFKNVPLPGVPENSLIGKIGQNGKPFYIGNGGRIILPNSGRLYIRINDQSLYNNVGLIILNIFEDFISR